MRAGFSGDLEARRDSSKRSASRRLLVTGAVRAFAGRVSGRRGRKLEEPRAVATVPKARWDNVGLAVDQAVDIFVRATQDVPGITQIEARSSGPVVRFLVTVRGEWDPVIREIEMRLYPLAQSGELPVFDYEIKTEGEVAGPGYISLRSG